MSKDPDLNRKHQETWRNNNREVQRQRNRDHRKKVREYIAKIKEAAKCLYCDEDHPACLDFHHRDPKEKDLNIAECSSWGMKRLIAELAKCDILCANCHRKLHWRERQNDNG